MAREAPAGLWDRLHGRNRILVTNLLLAVAGLVVVGRLVQVWHAWRQSSADGLFQGISGIEESRVISFAEALRFSSVQLGVIPTAFGALAAFAVLVLAGHASSARLPLGWRRGVVGVVVAVAALTLGQALLQLYVTLYTHTALSEDVSIFGLNDWGATLGFGITAAVEALTAAALIVLALAWWPGAVGGSGLLPDDEEDVLPLSGDDEDFTPPTAPPQVTRAARATRVEAEPEPAAPPPRLRPDGSSESGYDEFRFGR